MVTDPQTNKHTKRSHKPTNTQTGPITTHCAARLSTQCNNYRKIDRKTETYFAQSYAQNY